MDESTPVLHLRILYITFRIKSITTPFLEHGIIILLKHKNQKITCR